MSRTGRVAVLDKPEGTFHIEEKTLPEVKPGEILIKQERTGVCGTCVHMYHGHLPGINYPIILGHEIVGTIDTLGEGVETDLMGEPLKEGDRVYILPALRCGKCYFCSVLGTSNLCTGGGAYGVKPLSDDPLYFTGGYGDYVYLNHPWSKVLKMNVDPDTAVLLEPFSIGIHALDRVWMKTGSVVAIQGAGAIGLFTLVAAKETGAFKTVVIGAPASRLELAREYGADVTIDIEEITNAQDRIERVKKETPGGYGADVVFECAGVPTAVPEGIDMLRRGGTYVVAGHFTDVGEVSLNPFTHFNNKHITLVGVWGGKLPYFVTGKPILESGKYPFSKMVSHKLPLERVGDAMKAISTDYRLDGKEVRKIVIASDM
jgi:threonine dehydrogenase-like Zn-dependent dehydrogenase